MAALRLALVLALLSAPLVSALRVGASVEPLAWDARSAPERIGAYRAVQDAPLEPDVLAMLQPDSYVMRRYASESGRDVWLYLASYSGSGSTGAHDPEVCYPANGWDLRDLHEGDVPLIGDSMTAKFLLATQGGRQELVLYWFQPLGRWPERTPLEHLLRARDAVSGRPQYVFVRLSTDVGVEVTSGEELLVDFAAEVAPWLREAMEGARVDL